MTDQPKPCRSTQHCAVHGFCHRCTPSLDDATAHLVEAIDAAGIEYPTASRVYAQLAATVRDAARTAARQTTGQDDTDAVDPTAAIEVWARLLNAADVHVYGPEHAQWRNLPPNLQDQYRKAAAWLLPRLTIQPPPAHAVGQPAEAHGTDYDRDPAAIAWARAKIQDEIDRCRKFHTSATEAKQPEQAEMWQRLANRMESTFMGGSGCVIAYFDERLPVHRQAMEDER